jgi:hypothetical protein
VTDELHRVELIGLPLSVHVLTQEHHAELMREMYLIAHPSDELADSTHLELPARLLALVDELGRQFARFTTAQDLRLIAAVEEGLEEIDIAYELPLAGGPAAQHLADILDEVDDYCRAGRHLLTLATPPELVAYRRWFLSQLVEQLDGAPPTSWAQYRSR